MSGAFCEIYGGTIENRVLEYLLENQEIDIAIGDMAREIGISRPKAYQVMGAFLKHNIISKSRVIGKTQLFTLNKENPRVQLFLRSFKECLKIVANEVITKDQ